MAVTLYRCQKCRGLFAAVFEPNKWCRDCKFQQSGYQSQGGEAAQVTIIEPEEKTVGGKGAKIVNNQATQQSAQQFNNSLGGLQGLMGAGQQGAYSGGSEIRSPFTWTSANIEMIENLKPGNTFQYTDAETRSIVSVRRLDTDRVMIVDNLGSVTVKDVPPSWREPSGKQFRSPIQYAAPSEPKPESSPHDSILKPSRKLKFAAE